MTSWRAPGRAFVAVIAMASLVSFLSTGVWCCLSHGAHGAGVQMEMGQAQMPAGTPVNLAHAGAGTGYCHCHACCQPAAHMTGVAALSPFVQAPPPDGGTVPEPLHAALSVSLDSLVPPPRA